MQHGRPLGRAAAQQRPQPGQQDDVRERLGQVVVGAAVQPVGLVVLAVLGREHQHRHPVLLGPQLPHHPVAGEAGQHHVQDHRVVPAVPGQLEPGRPVAGHVHREALGLQPALQRRRQPRLVLHHQQPHGSSVPPGLDP